MRVYTVVLPEEVDHWPAGNYLVWGRRGAPRQAGFKTTRCRWQRITVFSTPTSLHRHGNVSSAVAGVGGVEGGGETCMAVTRRVVISSRRKRKLTRRCRCDEREVGGRKRRNQELPHLRSSAEPVLQCRTATRIHTVPGILHEASIDSPKGQAEQNYHWKTRQCSSGRRPNTHVPPFAEGTTRSDRMNGWVSRRRRSQRRAVFFLNGPAKGTSQEWSGEGTSPVTSPSSSA